MKSSSIPPQRLGCRARMTPVRCRSSSVSGRRMRSSSARAARSRSAGTRERALASAASYDTPAKAGAALPGAFMRRSFHFQCRPRHLGVVLAAPLRRLLDAEEIELDGEPVGILDEKLEQLRLGQA